MENKKINIGGCGGGLTSILTIIFVVCKIFGIIDWSWWLVFLPIIISFTLTIILLVVVFVLAVLANLD